MKKSWAMGLVFCAAAAGSFLVLAPSTGNAAFLTLHASACELETGTNQTGGGIEGKKGYLSNGSYSVICPFVERDDFTRDLVTVVTVYGARQAPQMVGQNMRVKVCRSQTSSDGGSCGTETTTTATGNIALQVQDLSLWSTVAGLPYVFAAATGNSPDFRGVGFDG